MTKSLLAFGLEIADYISDSLACANVYELYDKDVIPVGLVVFYLMVIIIGGLANFGNMLYRMQNFIELCKEYSSGISITSDDMKRVQRTSSSNKHDSNDAILADVEFLKSTGDIAGLNKLEDLTVKIQNITRQIRIEKFTFTLGCLEDLPVAIVNSILMINYTDDIDFDVIYFSTLITLLEFGHKFNSLEKIFMLKSRLTDLLHHVQLQRKFSVSKANKNNINNSVQDVQKKNNDINDDEPKV